LLRRALYLYWRLKSTALSNPVRSIMSRHLGFGFAALALLSIARSAAANDYAVAKTDAAAPTGTVAPEISALLDANGLKITKGGAPFCDIWLAKEWPIAADAKTGGEVLYPLTPGQLIGVIRYAKKASDFRDQDVPAGVYILRYAQQPIDGAHVGTSPTRDFFALLPAAKDRDPRALDYKVLVDTSKAVSGAAHPGILSLQAADGGGPAAIREVSDKEWVILHFAGRVKHGSAAKDLPVELVIVGKAAE
jgi:hypothetical protein